MNNAIINSRTPNSFFMTVAFAELETKLHFVKLSEVSMEKKLLHM